MNDVVINTKPRYIFRIDGTGAFISAICLLALIFLEDEFGMPRKVLFNLLPIASAFSIYSILCYYIKSQRWKLLLMIIAIANILYCTLLAYLVMHHFDKLTTLGLIFFLTEIIIIAILGITELYISVKKQLDSLVY